MFNFGGGSCANLLLNGFLKSERFSHAYLFCGDNFIGKKVVARKFAMAVFCDSEGQRPCFECDACRKFLNKNHVDYVELLGNDSSKTGGISVQQVRQLISDAFIKPVEGRFKIFLIGRVDELLPAAANALLKLIEEPPENVVFLLTAVSRFAVLPTIASRCVLVNVFGERPHECLKLLKELSVDLDEARLYQIVKFAEGSVEKAKLILNDSDWQNAFELALGLFDAYINRDELKFLQLVAKIELDSKLVSVVFKFFTISLNFLIRQKAQLNEPISLSFLNEIKRMLNCCENVNFMLLRNCNLKLSLAEFCCEAFSI